MLWHYVNENFVGKTNEIEKNYSFTTIEKMKEHNDEINREYTEFETKEGKRAILLFREYMEKKELIQEFIVIAEDKYL